MNKEIRHDSIMDDLARQHAASGPVQSLVRRTCAWPRSYHSWNKKGICRYCKQSKVPQPIKRSYVKKAKKAPTPAPSTAEIRKAFRDGYKVGLKRDSGPDENPHLRKALSEAWGRGWLAGSERCIRSQPNAESTGRSSGGTNG